MWTEQQYELAAKLAEAEREASLETVRRKLQADGPGSPDGACNDCGEEIGPARLEAIPSAVRCIECQVIHEKQQQQRARY